MPAGIATRHRARQRRADRPDQRLGPAVRRRRPWTFDERSQSDDLAAGTAATARRPSTRPTCARTAGRRRPRTGDIERMFTSGIDERRRHRSGARRHPDPAGQPGATASTRPGTTRARCSPTACTCPSATSARTGAWPLIVYLHGFANYLDEPTTTPPAWSEEADQRGYLLASPLERGDYSYQGRAWSTSWRSSPTCERHYRRRPRPDLPDGPLDGRLRHQPSAMHFPDLFAAIAPAEGTDSAELHANLRNVPWYEITPVEDLDAGGRQANAMYDRLSADGYDATLVDYGMKIHEYSSIYENLPTLFRFFGAHRRDPNPAVVTWTRPTTTTGARARLRRRLLAARRRLGAGRHAATVTVTSEAIAHRVPDPAAAQRTRRVVFDPNSPTRGRWAAATRRRRASQPAGPQSNTLDRRRCAHGGADRRPRPRAAAAGGPADRRAHRRPGHADAAVRGRRADRDAAGRRERSDPLNA